MTDAPDSKAKTAHAGEGIAGWVADNIWSPVKDNVLAPIGNVGVQAANAIHVTDGINLVKHASNDIGLTHSADSEKMQPFYVPKPDNIVQRTVQDLSSTAGSIVLYTLLAKGTSKVLGGTSSFMAAGEQRATALAEEQAIVSRPLVSAASFLKTSARATSVLAQEQNSLLVGATAYNAARDPEQGETRTGNAIGALAQFGVYRMGNARWSSSFSEQTGMYNKLKNVVLPRAAIGLTAGLAQDIVSNSVSSSINSGDATVAMGSNWKDNIGMNAAMNVVLPSLLGGRPGGKASDVSRTVEQPSTKVEQPSAQVEQSSAKVEQPSARVEQPSAKIEQPSANFFPENAKLPNALRLQTLMDEAAFQESGARKAAIAEAKAGAGAGARAEGGNDIGTKTGLRTGAKLETGITSEATRSGSVTELQALEKANLTEVERSGQPKNQVGDKVGRADGTHPEFPGITDNDAITRLIEKPNGTRVTVFESGRAVIQEPGKTPATSTPEGQWLKVIDGKVVEINNAKESASSRTKELKEPKEPVEAPLHRERPQPPDFSHLPENERPVNIGSGNGELIAKEMSNFEQSPFTIDGRTFQSVEGFYVWLKFSGDAEKQAQAQNMYSYEAKKFGKQSTATTANYDGTEIKLGSEEHHALIKRAIQSKLEQHPDIARRFAETYPRPIIHDFGYPEGPSRLPAAAFSNILSELREGLVKGDIVTKEGTTSELSARAEAAEAAKPKTPISDALRNLEGRPDLETHPLDRYARALENSGIQVVRFIAGGGDQLAFEIPNNQVLKVSTSTFPPDFVPRQFHLHITDPQVIDAGGGLQLQLYKQPLGKTPVTPQQYRDFKDEVLRQGWVLTDGAEDQLSEYNGGIKLHDPFAAQRAPNRR
jgi:hypothetical protein